MKLIISLTAFFASVAAPVYALPASLSRTTRPVTDAEIAGGAPVGGFVHDFFITSESDLLIVEGDADVPLFQHTLGSDVAPPWGEAALTPGITADSFITLPSGETATLGGGFAFNDNEQVWYDVPDSGPQQNFNFARLTTVGQTGTFSGQIFLKSHAGLGMPFSFVLPGADADMHLLASEGAYVPEDWYIPPPAPVVPAPTPSSPVPIEPVPGPQLPPGPSPPAPIPAPAEPPALPPAMPSAPAQPPAGPQISLVRHTRAVTAEEIAGGAPANGFVHEFFATSDSDLTVIGDVEVTAPIFQHTMGSDVAAATAESAALDPALAADSFIRLPGDTQSIGGGLVGGPGDQAWFDISDDGAQEDFLFARLTTVGETGSFSGQMVVRSHAGQALPFSFVLPGTEDDLALLASEPAHVLALAQPPAPTPIEAGPVPQLPPPTEAPILLPEPDVPATNPTDPPEPPNNEEGNGPAEPPMVVVIPTEPLVRNPSLMEAIIDPTLIDIDVAYPGIRIDYDLPAFQVGWWRIGDWIDVTAIEDGAGLQIAGWVDYDGGILDGGIAYVHTMGMTDLTGASLAGHFASDGVVLLSASSSNALIPEPSTSLLAMVAVFAVASARRGRRV